MKKKLDPKQIAALKDQAVILREKCLKIAKEPQGKGLWGTVWDFLGMIPLIIKCIGDLIDLLEGDDVG